MKLVLVAGPSGSGKDSVLRAAFEHYKDNPRVRFTRRCITRKPDRNEENIHLNENEFQEHILSEKFITHWQAHGNMYGILKSELINGINILSVSRTVISGMGSRFDNVTAVIITAEKSVLMQRLLERGRETAEQIDSRLSRETDIKASRLYTIDNSGPLRDAAEKFISLIDGIIKN